MKTWNLINTLAVVQKTTSGQKNMNIIIIVAVIVIVVLVASTVFSNRK